MDGTQLNAHISRLATEAPSSALMVEEVERRMAQTAHAVEQLHFDLLCADTIDASDADTLVTLHGTALREASEYTVELLLPLPSSVVPQCPHLLTPFPLCVETPALSPAFDAPALLTGILDRAGSASDAELRVS